MATNLLLTAREKDGEIVVETVDSRRLSHSGGSIATSYPREILELNGILDDDDLVERDVEQRITMRPESGELIVENRIDSPDVSALEELLEERLAVRSNGSEENGSRRPLAEH